MIIIDDASPVPPFEQVRAQLAAQITDHVLVAGTRLPSVRLLADDLGLAVNTVASPTANSKRPAWSRPGAEVARSSQP